MTANIFQGLAWPTLGAALLVFGLAPGIVLRLLLLIYPRGHPRRSELLAELYAVPMVLRPFWVAQQLEVALFEGLPSRWATRHRMSPKGRARVLTLAVVGFLLALLVFPLNWAAYAFGLNLLGTWLVTIILMLSCAAVMLAYEVTRIDTRVRKVTRIDKRRRGLLTAVFVVGCLALLCLRIEFLVVTAGESLAVGVLQASLLIAISAGLVLCGASVLARMPRELPRKDDRRRR